MKRENFISDRPLDKIVIEDPRIDKLKTIVYEAVGEAASLHWPESHEAFRASQSLEISSRLLAKIYEEMNR